VSLLGSSYLNVLAFVSVRTKIHLNILARLRQATPFCAVSRVTPMIKYSDSFLHDVFTCSSASLGLQGLARLAGCTERFRHICIAVAKQDAQLLLQRTLDTAGGFQPQTEQQHLHAVSWLLQRVPATSDAAAGLTGMLAAQPAKGLTRLPALPVDWAKRLVEAGVRITWAELLEAANSCVLGAEVWVQAQQQLGVQTDIPAAAIALCCGEDWVSRQQGLMPDFLPRSLFQCNHHMYGAPTSVLCMCRLNGCGQRVVAGTIHSLCVVVQCRWCSMALYASG
jgi:hypothetical protein